MANKFIYNLFSDYIDIPERIVQIKTDAITFSGPVEYDNRLFK